MYNPTLPHPHSPGIVVRHSLFCPPFTQPTVVFIFVLFAMLPSGLFGQDPKDRIVPRHPYAIELPELGRMTGIPGVDCLYGEGIYPIGDCNGDGIDDWIVSRRRCDTTVNGTTPDDLLLYKGRSGGLPSVEDRLRLGPSEVGSSVRFFASGDWNGDGHVDLAMTIKVFGDTSFGDTKGIGVSRMIVMWGNSDGVYGIADTTRLENGLPGTEGWIAPFHGYTMDFNRDGVDDLLLDGVRGYADGEPVFTMPPKQIFYGEAGLRWGEDRSRHYDWGCWGSFPEGDLSIVDQDADGLEDLVFYHNVTSSNTNGAVRIIYGAEGVVIDTNTVVEIDLTPANGKYSLLSDISGDGIPELLVNTGGQERLKVYIGLKGQRLTEQFGSGDEPGHPGESAWWGKPWGSIPLPGLLHDGWANSGWSAIWDFGDADLDGTKDIWVVSIPDYICYKGGNVFDSLYDAWIRSPGSGMQTVVGNIDGTGKKTIAISSARVVHFIQPSIEVPPTGVFRQLPPGTEKPMTGVEDEEGKGANRELGLCAIPNPSGGEVRVRWNAEALSGKGEIRIRVSDMLGGTVLETTVPGEVGEYVWDAAFIRRGGLSGRYFITVTRGEVSETTHVTIQQ